MRSFCEINLQITCLIHKVLFGWIIPNRRAYILFSGSNQLSLSAFLANPGQFLLVFQLDVVAEQWSSENHPYGQIGSEVSSASDFQQLAAF